jgi:hypothetical protein
VGSLRADCICDLINLKARCQLERFCSVLRGPACPRGAGVANLGRRFPGTALPVNSRPHFRAPGVRFAVRRRCGGELVTVSRWMLRVSKAKVWERAPGSVPQRCTLGERPESSRAHRVRIRAQNTACTFFTAERAVAAEICAKRILIGSAGSHGVALVRRAGDVNVAQRGRVAGPGQS